MLHVSNGQKSLEKPGLFHNVPHRLNYGRKPLLLCEYGTVNFFFPEKKNTTDNELSGIMLF